MHYTTIETFATALSNALLKRPTEGLADYRLGKLCQKYDDDGYGLKTSAFPFYGRHELPSSLASDVKEYASRKGIDGELIDRMDYADAGCAMCLLARLLDRDVADPIAMIRAEMDEIETTEMAQ